MIAAYFRELFAGARQGWNRFWFTPTDPATLGLIRILAGRVQTQAPPSLCSPRA